MNNQSGSKGDTSDRVTRKEMDEFFLHLTQRVRKIFEGMQAFQEMMSPSREPSASGLTSPNRESIAGRPIIVDGSLEQPSMNYNVTSAETRDVYWLEQPEKDETGEIYQTTAIFSGKNFRVFWARMEKLFRVNPYMSKEEKMAVIISMLDEKCKELDWARSLIPSSVTFEHLCKRLQEDYNSPRKLIVNEVSRIISRNKLKKDATPTNTAQFWEEIVDNIKGVVAEELFKGMTVAERESAEFLRINGEKIKATAFNAFFTAHLILDCDADTKTNINQAMGISHTEMPEFEKMIRFVKSRDEDLRVAEISTADSHPRLKIKAPANKEKICLHCGKTNHMMSQCYVFKAMNISERWYAVKKAKACQNCLNSKKNRCDCFKKNPRVGSCGKCEKIHHLLLHRDPKE